MRKLNNQSGIIFTYLQQVPRVAQPILKLTRLKICEWIRIKSADKHMAPFVKNLNLVYSLCFFP